MKTIIMVITIIILADLKIQADDTLPHDRSAFKPTLKDDDYDPPVYTSPTNGFSAVNHRTNVVIVPAITNWHTTNLPPMTNWPATNHLPALTNPPVSQPHRGQ